MNQTRIEKLISRKAGKPVKAGDLVVISVDLLVSHDGNRPQALDVFKEMGGDRVFDPSKVKLVIDHAPNVPNTSAASIHQSMRTFAAEQGLDLFGPGEGICRQIIPDKGFVVPGDFVLGTDSHTCTYGAFNVFGTGVGSSDLAAAMLTGETWLYVPETIKVELNGIPAPGITAKDIVLALVRIIRAEGATYQSLEFHGSALPHLSISGRMTIANMGVEMGAKAALFPADQVLLDWLDARGIKSSYEAVEADETASYTRVVTLDVSQMQPQISCHPSVENVKDLDELVGLPIQQAVIGTCTNGRLEDLREAAEVVKGRKVAQGVRFFVTPASRDIYINAMKEGIIATLMESGAVIGIPGCSGCTGGAHFAIPSDGDRVITTANRNFIGRLGNAKAELYLASASVVAASALTGNISAPNNFSRKELL
jgi:3-isopropylmalate/(R)-2-methylmalate dehydratase large subunit